LVATLFSNFYTIVFYTGGKIMSPDLERLVGRAVTDKDFRDKLLADPEGTVKGSGLSISAEELAKLKAGVKQVKPDQLDQQFAGLQTNW
jgi:hypothetical protein